MKKLIAGLLSAAMIACTLAGCSNGSSKTTSQTSAAEAQTTAAETKKEETTAAETKAEDTKSESSHYPVTYDTYNEKGEPVQLTIEKRPERVLSISQANTELLIALGLGDLIIGTAHAFSEPYETVADEYNALPFICESGYPSKEVVIAQEPDFIVGWYSLFQDDALGAISDWTDRGMGIYMMKNTVTGLGDRTVDRVYEDITELGKVFDVEDKAQAMIDDMKSRIAAVQDKVADIPDDQRLKVVTVQKVNENEWSGRGATDFNANLATLAGAVHINEYGTFSMETMIELNPDVIIIIDQGANSSYDSKVEGLLANDSIQNVSAIKNKAFFKIQHTAFYCGGVRTVPTIEEMAKFFYPERFQ